MKKVWLASKSPRRRDLLRQMGIAFSVDSANVDETLNQNLLVGDALMRLAYEKANVVFRRHEDDIVIGADTIVYFNGSVLGKPKDEYDAYCMLKALSGKTHQVMTGVAMISKEMTECFYELSEVTFHDLRDEEIQWYVNTREPIDKAGAYGIQGKGAFLVAKIVGDYYNIVGLPISKVVRKLEKIQNSADIV